MLKFNNFFFSFTLKSTRDEEFTYTPALDIAGAAALRAFAARQGLWLSLDIGDYHILFLVQPFLVVVYFIFYFHLEI